MLVGNPGVFIRMLRCARPSRLFIVWPATTPEICRGGENPSRTPMASVINPILHNSSANSMINPPMNMALRGLTPGRQLHQLMVSRSCMLYSCCRSVLSSDILNQLIDGMAHLVAYTRDSMA